MSRQRSHSSRVLGGLGVLEVLRVSEVLEVLGVRGSRGSQCCSNLPPSTLDSRLSTVDSATVDCRLSTLDCRLSSLSNQIARRRIDSVHLRFRSELPRESDSDQPSNSRFP